MRERALIRLLAGIVAVAAVVASRVDAREDGVDDALQTIRVPYAASVDVVASMPFDRTIGPESGVGVFGVAFHPKRDGNLIKGRLVARVGSTEGDALVAAVFREGDPTPLAIFRREIPPGGTAVLDRRFTASATAEQTVFLVRVGVERGRGVTLNPPMSGDVPTPESGFTLTEHAVGPLPDTARAGEDRGARFLPGRVVQAVGRVLPGETRALISRAEYRKIVPNARSFLEIRRRGEEDGVQMHVFVKRLDTGVTVFSSALESVYVTRRVDLMGGFVPLEIVTQSDRPTSASFDIVEQTNWKPNAWEEPR